MREAVITFPMFGEGFALNPPAYISIGSFNIYIYGICIALGFLLAVVYVSAFHERLGMDMDDVYDLTIFAVLAAIVGARLYYVVFNDPAGYFSDPVSILRIRDGGLAIYGGVIGAVIALALRCRHKKIPLGRALDVAALGLLIGQCVGRWGNFFNREAFGYETDVFCRMGLTLPGAQTIYVHPTFLYESLWNLAGFILLHFFCKKRRRYYGQLFILYLGWYGLGRMFIEGLRSDSLWLVPDVIRVSQLLAALSLLFAAALLLLNARRIKTAGRPLLGALITADGGAHDAKTLDNGGIIEDTDSSGDAGSQPEGDPPRPDADADSKQQSEP